MIFISRGRTSRGRAPTCDRSALAEQALAVPATPSFASKRCDRIDCRRAPRRYPRGADRDDEEEDRRHRDRRWVRRLDAEEQPVQELRQRHSNCAADRENDQRHRGAFTEDHPQDRAALGAERYANAELVRALADRER